MPRTARLLLPGTPHHIVQRGHNRASVFANTSDFEYYLYTLREWKETLGIRLYAYCLMTNHVHLILEPGDKVETVGQLMRRLSGRQTRYTNAIENRSGTLWNGRYKASPIQTDRYLLACSRYVELNPVRARIVRMPGEYPWSSYREKVGLVKRWIDEDPCFTALGPTRILREKRYTSFIESAVSEQEVKFIRSAVNRNQLTGNQKFVDEVAERIGRRVEHRAQGRPLVNEGLQRK